MVWWVGGGWLWCFELGVCGLNSVKACDWPGKAELSEWNCTAFIPAESADRLNGWKFGPGSTHTSTLQSDRVAVRATTCWWFCRLSELSLSIKSDSTVIKDSAGVQSWHIWDMELLWQPRCTMNTEQVSWHQTSFQCGTFMHLGFFQAASAAIYTVVADHHETAQVMRGPIKFCKECINFNPSSQDVMCDFLLKVKKNVRHIYSYSPFVHNCVFTLIPSCLRVLL